MMKKLTLFLLIGLVMLLGLPAAAEGTLETAAEELAAAVTLDEQLAKLYELSVAYADPLEIGGWDTSLTVAPAEELPEDLLPGGSMEEAELSTADFEGAKFISIYDDMGDYRLLGDFQVRIPEAMRAASLEEADAVLLLTHSTTSRSDYTGPAHNRNYYAYVYRRGANVFTTAYHVLTTPPVTGYGPLTGERLSFSELWNGVRQWFFGVIEISYPEGTAKYRITGQSCCLAGLEGDFTKYEIPAEVEGHPVVGIERCKNDTLEELVLPEGIVWIRYAGGKNLRRMNFPSTLRRIEDYVEQYLDEMILNEGLEEISDYALLRGCGESFALPSTLKKIGKGSLEYGAGCPYLVIPEGVTRLPDYFLSGKGRVLCVFVPASVTSIGGSNLFDYGTVRIYTPEGSRAANWAAGMGYDWVACDRAEDMPKPAYAVENGFEYAIVEGEAYLTGYSGDETCVRIPSTLGGCPVAVVVEDTFCENDTLRAVLFPDSVRRSEGRAIFRCRAMEAAFIPSSIVDYHAQTVFDSGDAVCYVQAGSAAEEKLTKQSSSPFEIWTPGLEDQWFGEP